LENGIYSFPQVEKDIVASLKGAHETMQLLLERFNINLSVSC